ncbi:phosphatidate cytidylyltransferase [Trueperella sp. LYQ143]|uniref:phosphatidate cytidylyltransferase n=1 Tax=unclassified Trueperella TaxID=2630174 RepID=UPI0039833C96
MPQASMQQAANIYSRLAPHPPRPPRETTSRAGRNLPLAVATAAVLLTIVGASLVFRIEIFVALAVLCLTMALWEAAGALLARDFRIPFPVLALGQALMLVATWKYSLGVAFLVLLGVFAVTTAATLVIKRQGALTDALAGCFTVSWLGLLGCFAVAMAKMDHPALVIVTFILLPVANDTGGWCAGVLLGKHPIAASISPKKSWEGFVGSVVLSLLVAIVMAGIVLKISWIWVIVLAVATPIAATAGDFAESLVKRDLGVKDMGAIFPGHGGVLDRIDSMLFCAPVCYLVFALGFGLL